MTAFDSLLLRRLLYVSTAFLIGSPGCSGDGGSCVEPSQPLSGECCLDHGIDACGAGLTCALLDGRTIPVCYPAGSRLAGETCTNGDICSSGHCDPSGICAQIVGFPCEPGQACGDPTGAFDVAICKDQGSVIGYLCEGVERGVPCGYCDTTEECSTPGFQCVDNVCKGTANANVPESDPQCCVSGVLKSSGSSCQ